MNFPSVLASTWLRIAALALLTIAVTGPVFAQSKGTGLPLPRFVSLRAGEVNMRTGPGVQYPVEWVYQRRQMPIEIIAEYGTWRKVRDWQGTQGWIHQSMLTGKRTFVITSTIRTIRRSPDANSPARARAEAGAIGEIKSCIKTEGWCRVEIGGYDGWLRRVDFWGVYQNEPVN